ncbi:RNA recognition motif domain [Arabidopsis suecica]|uniref:RNA-binding (RRM/RBD/RNP motifs) family protein n=2 Tax=Arabidopsis TaxID=3701 RepID=A0A1I9LPX6_ARATH|nr:RNA-binding (RRM/RBD/RNP motifs) family protein [Arabidopsis thaliana]ANM64634.1 RNA-binding (RRM/RBD/RNP motifs) family protein [Arabidopsis thaliana]KAG7632020.1 RNA recognition motif domain [Arabidopsis suecica]|eukprot:NP_001326648.1 RNA-binding (RRM/RBD/RNP motifs) family protein [Arabidopsis thaliana]
MEALIASTSFFVPISNSSSSHIINNRFFPSFYSPNLNFGTFRKTSLSSSHLVFSSSAISAPPSSTVLTRNSYWMVLLDKPPHWVSSKSAMVDYYVEILAKVLGNEKDAQVSIYDASFDTHFGFCCHIDEDASRQLASLPGVVSIRPEQDYSSEKKNYGIGSHKGVSLFDHGTVKHWMVRIDKPGVGIVTKAQMVDHCVQLLSKVLWNEKDAQMCLYHVSWQSDFGFCCDLDERSAVELAGVPGVLAVVPDNSFESLNKDYEGDSTQDSRDQDDSESPPVKTKKLFITGLSFYTSEKTLRAAFEGFGELVEEHSSAVKIIMDKISKRSKGYAFLEYTTEEAAGTALKEMNGKIINGWMIVVDVAKTKPFRQNRSQPSFGL